MVRFPLAEALVQSLNQIHDCATLMAFGNFIKRLMLSEGHGCVLLAWRMACQRLSQPTNIFGVEADLLGRTKEAKHAVKGHAEEPGIALFHDY